MSKLLIPMLVLMITSLASGFARGTDFYSVDVVSDRVVRVNTGTGVGTPLVDLGTSMVNPDLACVGDYLYVLDSDYYGGFGVHLIKVDMVSFQVVSRVTVTQDGVSIPNAEGLAAFDERLLIAYCGDCTQGGPWSNAIGELAESGEITLLYDYFNLDSSHDADGLTALANGHLLSIDLYYSGDNYRLSELVLPPNQAFVSLGVHSPATGMNDLVVLDDGDLWGVDPIAHTLNRLGTDGGILESVAYDPSMELYGLVAAGCGGTVVTGACCFPDGSCRIAGHQYCDTQNGTYQGDGTSCDPNPCEQTPVQPSTWGHIKAIYR